MKCHAKASMNHTSRTGTVLVLVLVVVMLLSFAVYSFSGLMVTEYTATTTGLTHIQRRELANSGIEIAALSIRQARLPAIQTNTDLSLNGPVRVELPDDKYGTVSILRRVPTVGESPDFGLDDESSRLNLNTLPLELSRRKEARQRLMALPGLTVQTADAILDWMDPDDDVSEFGAETSYYTSQTPSRRPAQQRFRDIRELLQVRGVTIELLYGEDGNANGILDLQEDDGDHNPPRDNNDGRLQRGWSQWLTVQSGESTLLQDAVQNPDARQKVDLNQPILARLFDQLEPLVGTEAATYIVSWRMRGATYGDEPEINVADEIERQELERRESVQRRLDAQLGQVRSPSESLRADQMQRGGISLSDGPMKFKSLIELFGGQVRISLDGVDTLLQSPWSADPVSIRRMLPVLERSLTVTDAEFLPGRININEASEIVLQTIPGVSRTLAGTIRRMQTEIRQSYGNEEFSSVAWLVSRGLVSTSQLRAMGPFITTHGDVRSGVAIGQTHGHLPVAMVEFKIFATASGYRLLSIRDLPVTNGSFLSEQR